MRLARGLVLALLVGVAVVAGISAFVAWRLTTIDRESPQAPPAALGLRYDDVRFPAATDGVRLAGWLVRPSGSDRRCTVVIVHGKGGTRSSRGALRIAAGLARAGYSVLLFDLAGHGESAFRRFSLGLHEGRDVLGAVRYAGRGQATPCVAGLGFSTGAVALLDAAAVEPGIAAVVADSAWADTGRLLDEQLPEESHLPDLFTAPVLGMAELLYGLDADAIRPLDDVARIAPRRVLLINGTSDHLVPVREARALARASPPGSELWLVAGAGHVAAHTQRPQDYMARLLRFLDGTLPYREPGECGGRHQDASPAPSRHGARQRAVPTCSKRASAAAPPRASTNPSAASGPSPGCTRSPSKAIPTTAGTAVWVTTSAAVVVVTEPRCIAVV